MENKDIKHYHRLKLWVPLLESLFFFFMMILVVKFDVSIYLENFVYSLTQNDTFAFLLFVLIFSITGSLFDFPISYYVDYTLEKKYNFSNQSIGNWIIDKIKALIVSTLITFPILIVFYFVLLEFGKMWWVPVGILLFLFSTLLARIAPTVIFPIFYKFISVEDSDLKDDLIVLCQKYNFDIEGVFKFDMSKKTKKANAGFAGIGKSKRIIISDTLLQNFNKDEIISIFAHELGHYKLKHLWKLMIINFILVFFGLWVSAIVYDHLVLKFGFQSVSQLAALPMLFIILYVYGILTLPISNLISRKYEYEADKFALSVIENKTDFINALKKLGEINASDTNPNPVIEFLFYDHPSLSKRIAFAEKF